MPSPRPKLVTWLAPLCVAFALAPSASGATRPTHAPPGNSAVQEFVETFPSGAGTRVTNDIANTLPAPPPSGALPPKARRELEELGPQGEAAASLAEATAAFADGRPGQLTTAAPNGKSAPAAALERLFGGSGPGGMGLGLPILIVLSLLAALSFGMRQRALTPRG